MSWKTHLVTTVRYLINDYDESAGYKNTDENIQKALLVAAYHTTQDYWFSNSYLIDIEALTLTPDPITQVDNEFIALTTLKAACIFNQNQYQGAIRTGIKVKSGSEMVDLTSGFSGYRDILEQGPCFSYKALLKQLRVNGSGGVGQNGVAVASVATHPDSGYYGNGVVRFFDGFGHSEHRINV